MKISKQLKATDTWVDLGLPIIINVYFIVCDSWQLAVVGVY